MIENNRRFHHMLTDGVAVEYSRHDGIIAGDQVFLLDYDELGNNDWLAVNQFTVIENNRNRRPDVVVLVNGLPLAVIELKNPGDENATVRGAFNQLQAYKKDIPSLFPYNELLVVSDGLGARAGTITAKLGAILALAHHRGQRGRAQRVFAVGCADQGHFRQGSIP